MKPFIKPVLSGQLGPSLTGGRLLGSPALTGGHRAPSLPLPLAALALAAGGAEPEATHRKDDLGFAPQNPYFQYFTEFLFLELLFSQLFKN